VYDTLHIKLSLCSEKDLLMTGSGSGVGLLKSVKGINGSSVTVQNQAVVVGSLQGLYPGDTIMVEQYGRDWRYTISDVIQISADDVYLIYPVEDERYTFVTSERLVYADGSSGGHILIVARLTN
jgi:TnpA family transposase